MAASLHAPKLQLPQSTSSATFTLHASLVANGPRPLRRRIHWPHQSSRSRQMIAILRWDQYLVGMWYWGTGQTRYPNKIFMFFRHEHRSDPKRWYPNGPFFKSLTHEVCPDRLIWSIVEKFGGLKRGLAWCHYVWGEEGGELGGAHLGGATFSKHENLYPPATANLPLLKALSFHVW